MKEYLETLMNNYKDITPPVGIKDLHLGKLRHQEGPSPSCMKIFFLVTVMLAETLDTKQFIVKPMQEITIWGEEMIMDIQMMTFGNAQGIVNRNYNPFDPLMDQNIVCYKCNNLGHKACNCRDMK